MKILLVKCNTILSDKDISQIRDGVLSQIKDDGVLVLDSMLNAEILEFDSIEVKDIVDTE